MQGTMLKIMGTGDIRQPWDFQWGHTDTQSPKSCCHSSGQASLALGQGEDWQPSERKGQCDSCAPAVWFCVESICKESTHTHVCACGHTHCVSSGAALKSLRIKATSRHQPCSVLWCLGSRTNLARTLVLEKMAMFVFITQCRV